MADADTVGPVAAEVEAFISSAPEAARRSLETLRTQIRRVIPEASEVIKYGIPTFRLKKNIVAIGYTKSHCSLYVMSTAVKDAHAAELQAFDTGKGTVRFKHGESLPDALVLSLVRARLVEEGIERE